MYVVSLVKFIFNLYRPKITVHISVSDSVYHFCLKLLRQRSVEKDGEVYLLSTQRVEGEWETEKRKRRKWKKVIFV